MRMPGRIGLFQCDRLIPAYQWVNIMKFLRNRENEFPMFSRKGSTLSGRI